MRHYCLSESEKAIPSRPKGGPYVHIVTQLSGNYSAQEVLTRRHGEHGEEQEVLTRRHGEHGEEQEILSLKH